MPRPKKAVPTERLVMYLPEPLLAEIHALLMDPVTGKAPYGAISQVGESLFRKWVRQQKEIHQQRDPNYGP